MDTLELFCRNTKYPITKIDMGDPFSYEYFEAKCNDILCMAEHFMMGSTTLEVDNPYPWIPYALLAGKSIEEVNKKRLEISEMAYLPIFFGLPVGYRVFCLMPLANSKSLEIPTPEIYRVLSQEDLGVDERIWKDKKYTGRYSKRD
jgi:hypothetical protein